MLCALLLLPLVAAVPVNPGSNYVIDMEDGVLKNVQLVGDSVTELDLSGKEIRTLEKGALDNLSGLKSLNLEKNLLESLPESVFSDLTSLEHLSLADNQLQSVEHLFVGLENLKVLDLSNNPIPALASGALLGLKKHAKIITKGNTLRSINTSVFLGAALKPETESSVAESLAQHRHYEVTQHELPAAEKDARLTEADSLKLCMSKNVVTSLELLKEGESVSSDCTKIVPSEVGILYLSNNGITGFEKGWYKLQAGQVVSIDFSMNNINELTPEMLNDLPAGLISVDISRNPLKKVPGKTIENEHLQSININWGSLEEIDEDAFEKTKLESLSIMHNPIKNVKFIAKLPETLQHFDLQGNKIAEIPDDAFSKLVNLQVIQLNDNLIETLPNHVFKGLDSVRHLSLGDNQIKKIDPNAFSGMKSLDVLSLTGNQISELEKGTFSHLEKLSNLDLSDNKFTKITKETFEGLPKSVGILMLERNNIVSLDKSSFVHGPRNILLLGKNDIAHIEYGAFDLPELEELQLNDNKLTSIDAVVYERLPNLLYFRLSNNEIAEIQKGACKHFGKLLNLDLSANPFKKLENGALHGLPMNESAFVSVIENQLEEIEAGVFDEA